jgi:hypothetical protein
VAQIETEMQARRTQRKKQMDMSKYMRNVFVKVDDVKASGPIRVRITDVSEGQFGKPDLTFHDRTQLSLNATNGRVLARAYGMESDDWLGKEIEFYVGEIQYRGEAQEAILVNPITPPIEKKAPPPSELDDAIPF